MNRLVLIDGNAILHRAYHALPTLTNKAGEPTQAVYGFVSILFRVIEDLKPTHLAVAFDRPGPTFRNELFKNYQAQRPEMEKELSSQVGKVHQVVEAMQIPVYELDGFEADDVLGTIAKQSSVVRHQSSDKIDEVVIVTGDRDLLQLVNDKVKLFMPVKGLNEGKLFGEKEVEERMGVKPKQIVDLKALMGDASDNYPGVAGIGPKTAISLIDEYRSLENIYKHIDQIKNIAVSEKLKNGKENALISQKLAQVVTDAPVKFELNKVKLGDLLTDEVIEVFGELGFKTLLKRLSNMSKKEVNVVQPTKKSEKQQMELF